MLGKAMTQPHLTPYDFIQKWKTHALTERASAQEHFIDLCRLFGHPTPAEDDPAGTHFAFEKGVSKTGGGDGWADVWKQGYFAWEYKKKKRDLGAAMEQLTRYAAGLENPPLLVVCDTVRFRIETRWTNTELKVYNFELENLADPHYFDILRAVFHDPEKLKSKKTRADITEEAAKKFQTISDRLQHRHADKEAVAHFINQLVFCFFADSVKLLPEGLWRKMLDFGIKRPARFDGMLSKLFNEMRLGGDLDFTLIKHFNGGLFDGRDALPLQDDEISLLLAANSLSWGLIDPTIFGTLFERFLDPDKRAQIGAHYTDPGKIKLIIDPVIVNPLKAEWARVRSEISVLMAPVLAATTAQIRKAKSGGKGFLIAQKQAEKLRDDFLLKLEKLRILDPACGSGNFLYVALQAVRDIEYKAILDAEALGLGRAVMRVSPRILHGIEINPFAAELARSVIWIGDIQWELANGIHNRPEPILESLNSIECRDALLTFKDGKAEQAKWPEVDYIIGNPPFLGGKKLRNGSPAKFKLVKGERVLVSPGQPGLGDEYVDRLFSVYKGSVGAESDLVCYWFFKGWQEISAGRAHSVGFVSTNSIRGGVNRHVLDPIASKNAIFDAWSDEAWVVDGAAVRVSLVCFGNARHPEDSSLPLVGRGRGGGKAASPHPALTRFPPHQGEGGSLIEDEDLHSQAPNPDPLPVSGAREGTGRGARLNGGDVSKINADLTESFDLTVALAQPENGGLGSNGASKKGKFEVEPTIARAWLTEEFNPNGKPNSIVLRQTRNGSDITGQAVPDSWLIDFTGITESEAALFQAPFQHVIRVVKPARMQSKSDLERRHWWQLARPATAFQKLNEGKSRFAATSAVSKHRSFVWIDTRILPDHSVVAIARDDDTTFGILHSKFHEAWALRLGTSLEDRPRYTPTTTFATFPFPEGLTPNIPSQNYADDPRAVRIAAAAKRLDDLRRKWLNPPDLVDIVPEVVAGYPDRIVPKNVEAAAKLKTRTLTNLYNTRPQWLDDAHLALDRAVAAAYGWAEDISIDEALGELLTLNKARAAAQGGQAQEGQEQGGQQQGGQDQGAK